MALSRRANQLALVVAAPLAVVASLMEIVAICSASRFGKLEAHEFADMLYLMLGYPLTWIIFILAPTGLQGNQDWWGIPLLNALLIFQWMVWFQATVLIGRALKRVWRIIEIPPRSVPTIWPDRITRADGRRFKLRPYEMRSRFPKGAKR
jgi:hypothetical protein